MEHKNETESHVDDTLKKIKIKKQENIETIHADNEMTDDEDMDMDKSEEETE